MVGSDTMSQTDGRTGPLHKALFFLLHKEILKYIVYDNFTNDFHYVSCFDISKYAISSCKPRERVDSIFRG